MYIWLARETCTAPPGLSRGKTALVQHWWPRPPISRERDSYGFTGRVRWIIRRAHQTEPFVVVEVVGPVVVTVGRARIPGVVVP